jgi:aspartate kinase
MSRENGNIVIQKYGGTSVGNPDKLKTVAKKIVERKESGDRLVVVVSAMGNTTDDLVKLAHEVSPTPSRRELDMLLSVGERISMTLLSMAINDLGHEAISFTGSQSGIITDERHTNARIIEVRAARIVEELGRGKVVIVAGYQGVSRSKEVTTLGRGGSDTTAIALAAALGARACEIYTDVDGVYTADPRVVRGAMKHEHLTYGEMLALSAAGGIVLKKEAMEYAKKHGINLVIRSSFNEDPGTTVRERSDRPAGRVIGIMQESHLTALLLFGDEARERALAFIRELDREGIEVKDFILDSADLDTVARHLFIALWTPHENDRQFIEAASERLFQGIRFRRFPCASVSVVAGLESYLPELYCKVLQLLGKCSVRIYGMKKGFSTVSAYIEAERVAEVANLLHEKLVVHETTGREEPAS